MRVEFPNPEKESVTVVSRIDKLPMNRDLFHGYNIVQDLKSKIISEQIPLDLIGWVVGKTPVVAIEVCLNNRVIEKIPISVRRPKLAERFGDLVKGQDDNFGFRQAISASQLPEVGELILKAEFSNGTREPIGSVNLELQTAKELASSGIGPDFIIIGAMKAATTASYNYLEQHPRVIARPPKELHFFSQVQQYSKGWKWYLSLFSNKEHDDTQGKTLIGEASPSYLFDPDVPVRIRAVYPNVKLIASLRNPTDRAISHYYHQVKRQKDETRSLEEAFSEAEIEKCIDVVSTIGYDVAKGFAIK